MDPPPPISGELLKIDDIDTGFSPSNPKENRPYVVIGTAGRQVRVVPHSTLGDRGVHVPGGVVEALDEGHFVPWAASVAVSLAATCENIGYLPELYLAQVRQQATPWPPR